VLKKLLIFLKKRRLKFEMKILFLSDNFLSDYHGGAEIGVFNLAKGLQKKGHSLFIITITQDKSGVGESEYEGIKIFKVYSKYHPFLTNYFCLYNPQIVGTVQKIIKKNKPDIVHAQNIHNYISYYCLKVAKKYAKAVFLTAHDTMLFSYGKFDDYINKNDLSVQKVFNYKASALGLLKTAKKRYNPFRNIIIRHYLKKYVDKIFTNSGVLQKSLEDNGIKNIATVHYATDIKPVFLVKEVDNFKAKYNLLDKKVILFGGRLSPAKGGEVSIMSLKHVIEKIPNAVLLIAGVKNDYSKYMDKVAKKLGIKENIVFTGWLDRDEMNLAYASCDIVITPSLYLDAFNLFNLEAMSAGKPVVGTCFGGTPEVIKDSLTGYVVNPFNIQMLAEKIIDLLQDTNKTKKFGEAGIKRAKKYFNMNLYINKMLGWYKKFVI